VARLASVWSGLGVHLRSLSFSCLTTAFAANGFGGDENGCADATNRPAGRPPGACGQWRPKSREHGLGHILGEVRVPADHPQGDRIDQVPHRGPPVGERPVPSPGGRIPRGVFGCLSSFTSLVKTRREAKSDKNLQKSLRVGGFWAPFGISVANSCPSLGFPFCRQAPAGSWKRFGPSF